MFLIVIGILCIMMGYMMMSLVYIIPELRLIYFDLICIVFLIVPFIIACYRVWISGCWKQVDRIPIWKQLVNYVRRDNRVVQLIGERAYPGESFIDIPNLGLVEFLGKDTVYNMGDKKIVWGLENLNFTPDPKYGNFIDTLWKLGFTNSDEVKAVLNGELPDLRDKVYENIVTWENGGAEKLTSSLVSYEGDTVKFDKSKDVNVLVDGLLSRRNK